MFSLSMRRFCSDSCVRTVYCCTIYGTTCNYITFSFFKVDASTFSILLSYRVIKRRLKHGETMKVRQMIYWSSCLRMWKKVMHITIALMNILVEYLNLCT